jgi:hypothetical protein
MDSMKPLRSVISSAIFVVLTVSACGSAEPADPAAEPPDTVSAGADTAVLEGLRFDVRRDPG